MARKYEKYFVGKDNPDLKFPDYMHYDPKNMRHIAHIDENAVKGAEFGCDNIWLLPGGPKEQKLMDANTQNYDRYFGFFSYNYDNIRDLCTEMEVYIGGEKHIVNKSGCMFIPAGLEAGPITLRNITKPIFLTIEAPCGTGISKKWD
jgi:hypothetical protein